MKKALIAGALALAPLMASAQLSKVSAFAVSAGAIIRLLIPIVFALAMLYFFWGLATYILGSEHDAELAKKRMIWGVVALFVMASVWGLVAFLGDSLGITATTAPVVDTLIPR